MSAWIVTKAHIDVLVHALGTRELFPDGFGPDEVGRLLWQENHDSVNYRYDEHDVAPLYTYEPPAVTWDANEVLLQTTCYEYQTCEHDGWADSEAYRLTETLRLALLAGGAAHDDARDMRTPWGVPSCGQKHQSYRVCADCLTLFARTVQS